MDTETLNEYIFSKLVLEFAAAVRNERVEAMIDSGTPEREAEREYTTQEDFIEGLRKLERCRNYALSARESLAEAPEPPPAAG